jgi:transketolase C-terminal domain/subunit
MFGVFHVRRAEGVDRIHPLLVGRDEDDVRAVGAHAGGSHPHDGRTKV